MTEPISQWVECAGCGDLTPPRDIVDGHCLECNDGRVFTANMEAARGLTLRQAATWVVGATDVLARWDREHGYVINADRDALSADLSEAWAVLRAALARRDEQ